MNLETKWKLWLPIFILGTSGCVSMQPMHEEMPMPEYTTPIAGQATSGAIYESQTSLRLFEDRRAGRVGDVLTVRLLEQTNASQSSSTETSKSTSASLTNPTVLGRPITRNGDEVFGGSLAGDMSFDGEGASNQSNSLTGDITVTVIERLSNGNLIVQGEKWVTINQAREFIRLKGIVRSIDIGPDNSIASGKVANAQITYSSKGVMAAANRMGLISRFFHSIFYPY